MAVISFIASLQSSAKAVKPSVGARLIRPLRRPEATRRIVDDELPGQPPRVVARLAPVGAPKTWAPSVQRHRESSQFLKVQFEVDGVTGNAIDIHVELTVRFYILVDCFLFFSGTSDVLRVSGVRMTPRRVVSGSNVEQ